jgi:hypothetical protein
VAHLQRPMSSVKASSTATWCLNEHKPTDSYWDTGAYCGANNIDIQERLRE